MVIIQAEKARLGFKMEVTITHMQRLEIRLLGKAFVGYRARDGWRQSLPFYAFRCPVHGLVEDYPHGYAERLDCPLCSRKELAAIRVAEDEAILAEMNAVPLRTN
jgi:hypothetical protein